MPIFLLLNNCILLEFGFLFLHWHIKLYLFVMYNSVCRWIHTLWVGSSISLVNAFPLAFFVLRTFSILALSIVYTICYHPHSHPAVQRFLEVTSPTYLTINICLWLASFKAVSLLSLPPSHWCLLFWSLLLWDYLSLYSTGKWNDATVVISLCLALTSLIVREMQIKTVMR